MTIVVALSSETEVVFDVTVLRCGTEREAGVLRHPEIDGAVRVLDIDCGQRDSARRRDCAVAVRDGDAALHAVEGDVFIVGLENDGAEDFTGIEAVTSDAEVSVDTGGFEVSTAGLEEDDASNVLEVGGAEEVTTKVDGAGDFGEVSVTVVTLDGEIAGDAVRVEAGVVIVDVNIDIAVDGVEVYVSMIGGEGDGGMDFADGDIAFVSLNGDGGVVWDFDNEITLSAID